MKRVVVLSTASGNGKTTVGRALAERLGVPFHELDALNHGPNWTEATAEELRAKVEPIVATEAWVIDGAYRGKLGDLVLERADVVVWLDLPDACLAPSAPTEDGAPVIRRRGALEREPRTAARRALSPQLGRVSTRSDIIEDAAHATPPSSPGFRVVRLRSQGEVDDFLRTAERET